MKQNSLSENEIQHRCTKCGLPCSPGEKYCRKCKTKRRCSIVTGIITLLLVACLADYVILNNFVKIERLHHTEQTDDIEYLAEDTVEDNDEVTEIDVDPEIALPSLDEEKEEVTEKDEEADEKAKTQETIDKTWGVVGCSSETAISNLQGIGYPIEKKYVYSDSMNQGCVISAEAQENCIVLEISRGHEHTHCSMYKINSNGDVDYIRTYHKDSRGYSEYCDRYDGNGNYSQSVIYETDEDGVLKKVLTYNLDGSIHHTWVYDHDIYGRIVGENYHDATGKITDRDEYIYNEDGQLKEYLEYDENGLYRRWIMREYDDSVSLMSCSPHVIGNWTYADIYDKNGKLIRHATQTFDEYGVCDTMTVKKADGSLAYQYVFQSAWVSENNEYADDILYTLGVA